MTREDKKGDCQVGDRTNSIRADFDLGINPNRKIIEFDALLIDPRRISLSSLSFCFFFLVDIRQSPRRLNGFCPCADANQRSKRAVLFMRRFSLSKKKKKETNVFLSLSISVNVTGFDRSCRFN